MKYDIVKIKITNRCNRKCSFCVFNDSHKDAMDLSFEEFVIMINKIKEIEFGKFHLNGGEPLMHPDFIRMTKYARETFPNAKMVLGTNAILLSTPVIIDFIKEYFDEICIGCDTEHGNIESVGKVVPELLKNNKMLVVLNSIIEYTNPFYFEKLESLKTTFGDRIILAQNNVYHIRKKKPLHKLKGLCRFNSSKVLLIQEDGFCYRCFNCEVPYDREFNIFDEDFNVNIQEKRNAHYCFCAWCPQYQDSKKTFVHYD